MTAPFDPVAAAAALPPPIQIGTEPDPEVFDPFPLAALPPGLREWAPLAARTTGTPVSAAALIGLTVLSAAQGPISVEVTPTWHDHGSLWAMFVAEPGMAKSPALDSMTRAVTGPDGAMKYLRRAWNYRRPALEKAVKQAEAAVAAAQAAFDELDGHEDDFTDRQDVLFAANGRLEAAKTALGHPPDPVTRDTTPEGLADHLAEQPSTLGIVGEGDVVFTRLTAKDGGSAAIWLHAKNAETFSTRLRSRGKIHVDSPFLSVAMMVQPGVFERALGIGVEADRGRGVVLEFGGWLDRWIIMRFSRARSLTMAELRAAATDAGRMTENEWTRDVVDQFLATWFLSVGQRPRCRMAPAAVAAWDCHFDAYTCALDADPGPRPGAARKAADTAIRVARIRAVSRAVRALHGRPMSPGGAPANPYAGSDIASPEPTQLDPDVDITITAEDVDAGWAVAQWSMRQINRFFGGIGDTEAAEQDLLARCLGRIRVLAASGQTEIRARDVYRGVRGMTAGNAKHLLRTLAGLNWAVVTGASEGPVREWRIYPRPDIVRAAGSAA